MYYTRRRCIYGCCRLLSHMYGRAAVKAREGVRGVLETIGNIISND